MRQANLPQPVATINPATLTASATGAGVEHDDCHGVRHTVNVGESGDTLSGSVLVNLIIQDSDDGSTWADVTDADHVVLADGETFDAADGIFRVIDAAAEDDAAYSVDYIGDKAHSRVFVQLVGTHTNGIPIGATAQKVFPRKLPA